MLSTFNFLCKANFGIVFFPEWKLKKMLPLFLKANTWRHLLRPFKCKKKKTFILCFVELDFLISTKCIRDLVKLARWFFESLLNTFIKKQHFFGYLGHNLKLSLALNQTIIIKLSLSKSQIHTLCLYSRNRNMYNGYCLI